MKRSIFLAILLVNGLSSLYGDEKRIGLGNGLADAINEVIADPQCHELVGSFIDLFLNKVSYDKDQWKKLQELCIEGRNLLIQKTDENFVRLQVEYEREYQELFDAIFDKETGNLNLEGSEEFLKEALAELQSDERFEEIRSYQRREQEFKKKIATCLLADLNGNNKAEDSKTADRKLVDQFSSFRILIDRLIEGIENKLHNQS